MKKYIYMGRYATQSMGEEEKDICSEVTRMVLTDAGKNVGGMAKSGGHFHFSAFVFSVK